MAHGRLTSALAASLGVATALAIGLGTVQLQGQVPGRNVNMVSGTTLPDGDPFLQRQNEPSIAASTRNPLHLLAGANDYRTVDLPGLPNGEETGDAWLGLFTSTDGGQRWTSTLVPGYPQDPHRAQSPLRHYAAAADPVVRAGTNGLVYYAGLAFNRDENGSSGIFVARFIDNNNVEAGDPFAYLGTSMVAADAGVTGRSLDKPWLAVDVPRGKAASCRIETQRRRPNPAGGPPIVETIVQNVPAGPVYMAYSVFTGDGATLRSSIMFSSSADCGVSWSAPRQLSATDDSINQGATIAIDPSTGSVYVAWRRFTRPGSTSTDAMMIARSMNFGKKFQPSRMARKMPRGKSWGLILEKVFEHRKGKSPVEVEELSQFDQPTTPSESSPSTLTFRTNSYPTIAFDDRSRLYLAWSERGFSTVRPGPEDGDAKIVMSTSSNGTSWTDPAAVAEPDVLGHQVMPSLAFAGGKLVLVYYDLRENLVQLSSKFVVDVVQAFTAPRHTIDIRASMGTPGAVPAFAPSVRVSDYLIGVRSGAPGARTFPCGVLGEKQCEQLQYNRPNLPMFKLGTAPFMGDYIDIAPAPAFVPARSSGTKGKNQAGGDAGWVFNTSSDSHPVFHAVWTDNRDVRPPSDGDWTNYTPAAPFSGGQSVFDPSQTVAACTGDNSGSRNQNVYTARITGGLLAGSPGNTKPLSPTLQRGFVVFAQNTTASRKTFRMRIVAQPAGGRASFQQLGPTVTSLDVVTPARSTASRTVFATSTDPHALIEVEVFEIDEVGGPDPAEGTGLRATVTLNADIENPDIENADIENADIENADIENTEVTNADIENPTIRVADIENADIENPDIENADIENADIENADIENADIENADIENADIENASLTDVTWTVTNTGNTTTAFNVNFFLAQQNVPGVKVQLVLHKSYLTPAAIGCEVKTRSQTILIANIPNPVFVTPDSGIPDPNSPDATNGTIWLAPGEVGKITLRLRDSDPTNNVPVVNDKGETVFIDPAFVPGVAISPVVTAQEIGTALLNDGVTEPPIITSDDSTLFFVTQPSATVAGDIMAPVRVQVRGRSGAAQSGATVTLAIAEGPAGAVVLGSTVAVTGADGVAEFTDLRLSLPGVYRLRAAAAFENIIFAPTLSGPFTILPRVAPVIEAAVINSAFGMFFIPVALQAQPGDYTLAFFAGASCPAEGASLLFDRPIVITGGVFTATIEGSTEGTSLMPGMGVVAQAIDASGTTTGFSNCVTVQAADPVGENAVIWSAATGGNGHYYQYVTSGFQPWNTADGAARLARLQGRIGHLVTISSAAENAIVQSLKGAGDIRAWIGLSAPGMPGAWQWVTGEPFNYANWSGGEPNNLDTERWVEFFASGKWNNNRESGDLIQGYVVEYDLDLVGQITDPAGDASSGGDAVSPDLVSATVFRDDNDLLFRVRFAPGTFNATTSAAQLILDTDRTAATGHPGVNAGCQADSAIIGAEFLAVVQDASATLLKYGGVCNSFTLVSGLSMVAVADGYDVRLPLTLLEEDDGALHFKVTVSSQLPSGGFTGVLDYMSDIGLPAGAVAGGTGVILALTKTDSADPVDPGRPFTYTVTVTNAGTTLATEVVVVVI